MRKITQTIVGTTPPLDKNVLWLDTTNSDSPVEKVFLNGEWKATSDPSIDAYTKEESDERFLENATNEGSMSQVLKIGDDNKPVWANVPGATDPDERMSDVSENAVQNKAIKKYIDSNFARQDGWYDTLVSGAAKNLVGHGTTPAEYTFRTSGGNADIGTGTASIDVMKGKTLKWQQKFAISQLPSESSFTSGIKIINNNDGSFDVVVDTGGSTAQRLVYIGKPIIPVGHKVCAPQNNKVGDSSYAGTPAMTGISNGVGTVASSDTNMYILVSNGIAAGTYKVYPMCFDLTEMGLDSITSAAEFEALYPLNYYAYTATPVLINNAASGIVTTGFNQYTSRNNETGFLVAATGVIQSNAAGFVTDYIPVIAGQTYYFSRSFALGSGSWGTCYYDAQKNHIGGITNTANPFTLTIPSNVRYIRTCGYVSLIETACINLSWSGYRNGEYEPYEKHTLYFDTIKQAAGGLNTVKGRLLVNGEPTGESVTIFPDGWKSVGSVYDFGKADSDGYIRKVTKRIGSVDLGSLTWNGENGSFSANVANIKKAISTGAVPNVVCTKYLGKSWSQVNTVDGIYAYTGINPIIIQDNTTYSTSTAAQFKTAMSGVPLYYELNTPEEYLLDTPIPANYIVNDFGTEQRIPVDTATANGVMSPIDYTVVYAMNASDQLRRMRVNFVSATGIDNSTPSTLDNLLTCLGTALNGTFTKSSYDSENENYTFTFTPNETPGE